MMDRLSRLWNRKSVELHKSKENEKNYIKFISTLKARTRFSCTKSKTISAKFYIHSFFFPV